jgi:NitT/TauT family transport system substrate-binding protein
MRTKPVSIIGVILFSAIAISGCETEPRSSTALEPVTINQWGQALIYLPLYIAVQEGFFEEEGLEVTITNGGGDDLTWAAVSTGNADFGIADPIMVAIAHEQGGVPGKVVGNVVGKVAFWAVTLDTTMKPIAGPSGFKGQTVAAFRFPNTANALALETFKEGKLVVGKDVKVVDVDYSSVLAQLQRHEATIAMVLEPAASIAEASGARVVYSYPETHGSFAFTGLMTRDETIRERPEVVQKVANALQRALRLAHTDFQRAVRDAQLAFPDVDSIVVRKAVRRLLDDGTIPEHITPDIAGWEKAVAVAISVGKLKSAPPLQAVIDTTFGSAAFGRSTVR